jgi:uracil phosphoribosyltransferase
MEVHAHVVPCRAQLASVTRQWGGGSGNSAVADIDRVKEHGCVSIKLLCVVAAPEGFQNMLMHHPDLPIVTASLDRQLDSRGYIVPGLGSAGDRIYGTR